MLLDASGDVVAIVDDGATTAHGYGPGSGGGGSTSPARLCAQFAYDPYGVLLAVQELHPFPDPRTGHKGLHLDRLDAGVADPISGAPVARHTVGATHAYFVRNRHYAPELGRFMQRDPNASGLPVASISPSAGVPGAVAVDLAGVLADGPAIYQYCRGRTFGGSDPSGLWFGFAAQMATMAIDTSLNAIGTMEDARQHLRYGLSFVQLLENYMMDQVADVEWAMDWDGPDDGSSKAGVVDLADLYGINTNFDGPTFAMGGMRKKGKGSQGNRPRRGGSNLEGVDYEDYIRQKYGMGGSFKVDSREFDARWGQAWVEMKTSPTANFENWADPGKLSKLGNQAQVARENGRRFLFVTPSPIPKEFANWLTRKGILHRVLR